MPSDAENAKVLRDAASAAKMTDAELVAACQHVVSLSQPSAQQIIDTAKAFAAAQEDPRDALKRKLFGEN